MLLGAARAALLAWAAAHVATCLWAAYSAETGLRAEARLLTDRVCGAAMGLGGALINCDAARAALQGGPLALVVFERAGARLLQDTFAAARREVAAFLRLVGFMGALASGVLLISQALAMRAALWRRRSHEEAACSEAYRTKNAAFVAVGDGWTEDT